MFVNRKSVDLIGGAEGDRTVRVPDFHSDSATNRRLGVEDAIGFDKFGRPLILLIDTASYVIPA